jgi:hypothetical protein
MFWGSVGRRWDDAKALCGGLWTPSVQNQDLMGLPPKDGCGPAPVPRHFMANIANWFGYIIDRAGLKLPARDQCAEPDLLYRAIQDASIGAFGGVSAP